MVDAIKRVMNGKHTLKMLGRFVTCYGGQMVWPDEAPPAPAFPRAHLLDCLVL